MSLAAQITQIVFRVLNFKQRVLRNFRDPSRKGRVFDPGRYPARLNPRFQEVYQCRTLTLGTENVSGKGLVFLPGGAYLLEPTTFHGQLAQRMAESLGIPVTLLGYPLAPESDYLVTHQGVRQVLERILSEQDETYLMGDSAGGGLALSLLQILKAAGIQHRPRKTVLISPWLDLSLNNPGIPGIATNDAFLSPEALGFAARAYAGEQQDLRIPALSPLYGDLSDLGELLLFCGTQEILYPDCRLLKEKLDAVPGSQVEFRTGAGLFHDWVIFPLPEAREAVDHILHFFDHGSVLSTKKRN